jgi:hypothetical protein
MLANERDPMKQRSPGRGKCSYARQSVGEQFLQLSQAFFVHRLATVATFWRAAGAIGVGIS